MADRKRIVIDAGHGGQDPGAVFEGRREKDDTLRLALAVGQILSDRGLDVLYTRVTDVYQTPLEKAQIANNTNADYFLSIHRNAMPVPGTASGVESLVYENTGVPALMARNINQELEQAGFQNLGVTERPGLIVLRRTRMPAVLVEAGFLDNERDNQFFDANFERIARGIAEGILETVQEEEKGPELYQIQVGVFSDRSAAERLLRQLREQEFPVFLVAEDGGFRVRVGAFLNLDHAVRMEQRLRGYGYSTYMVKERARE